MGGEGGGRRGGDGGVRGGGEGGGGGEGDEGVKERRGKGGRGWRREVVEEYQLMTLSGLYLIYPHC